MGHRHRSVSAYAGAWKQRLDREGWCGAKEPERRARFGCRDCMFPGDEGPFVALSQDLLNESGVHGMT